MKFVLFSLRPKIAFKNIDVPNCKTVIKTLCVFIFSVSVCRGHIVEYNIRKRKRIYYTYILSVIYLFIYRGEGNDINLKEQRVEQRATKLKLSAKRPKSQTVS